MRLSSPHRPHGRHVAGNSLVPILIIVAALGISAAIFFLFTKKKMEAGKAAEMAEAATKPAEEPAKDPSTTPVPPSKAGDKPATAGSTAPAMAPGATPATAPAPAPTTPPRIRSIIDVPSGA